MLRCASTSGKRSGWVCGKVPLCNSGKVQVRDAWHLSLSACEHVSQKGDTVVPRQAGERGCLQGRSSMNGIQAGGSRKYDM